MMPFAIFAAILLLAFLYALAGQSGGTAFLAVMTLFSFPAAEIRPTALVLNLVAAGYTTWRLHRSKLVDWSKLLGFALPSTPFALAGGLTALGGPVYFLATGTLLVAASALMLTRRVATNGSINPGPQRWSFVVARTAIGFLSGLTGIGGGVFLAPLIVGLGWATPRQAAFLAPPFILINSAAALPAVLATGQMPSQATPWLALAVLVGALAGTAATLRWVGDTVIKYLLAAIVMVAGLRLLYSAFVIGV